MNVFEILEISPTDDKREIKKAYARLVKKYHPEEHPQEWKNIHDAYLAALKMSDCSAGIPSQTISVSVPDIKKPEERVIEEKQDSLQDEIDKHLQRIHELEQQRERQQEEPENEKQGSLQDEINKHLQRIHELEQEKREAPEDKMEDIFDRIDEFAEAARENSQKELQELLQAAMKETELISKKKHLSTKKWKEFFQKEEYQSVIRQGEFLYDLADKLYRHTMDWELYSFLKNQLYEIRQYNANVNEIPKKRGTYDAYQMVDMRLTSACRGTGTSSQNESISRKELSRSLMIILLTFCMVLYLSKRSDDSENKKREQMIIDEKANYIEIINQENYAEQILRTIDLLTDEQQKKLLQSGQQIADGIYILGSVNDVPDLLTKLVSDQEMQTQENNIEISSYTVKQISDIPTGINVNTGFTEISAKSYAFSISTKEEEDIIIYCDPQILTGQEKATIYYYDQTCYAKYQNSTEQEAGITVGQRSVYDINGYQVFHLVTGTKPKTIYVVPAE